MTSIIYNSIIQSIAQKTEYFHCSKNPLCSPIYPSSSSLLHKILGNHWSFYCLQRFAFSRMSYNESKSVSCSFVSNSLRLHGLQSHSGNHVICMQPFPDWLPSLSNMHLLFLYVFSWLDSSFVFSTESYLLCGCTSLLTEGHLGCFQALAIMNKAAVNICVQVCVWTKVINSLS